MSLRDELAGSASHRRVPAMAGELLAAFEVYLEFCVNAGAITAEDSDSFRARCRSALVDSAERQEAHQAASDPVERFFSLIASVISSGRGHVAAVDGRAPGETYDPGDWGWRRAEDGGWYEQGRCIGWIEARGLLLDPEAAFAEANKLAADQGEVFGVGQNTLYKRVAERSLLVSADPKRHTARLMIGGARRRVLHLKPSTVTESGPSGPSGPASGPDRAKQPENGPPSGGNGPLSGTAFSGPAEKRSTKAVQNPAENGASGPVGPVGPLSHTDNGIRHLAEIPPGSF